MSKTCKVILFLTTVAGILGFLFVLMDRKKQMEEPLFQDDEQTDDNKGSLSFEPTVSTSKKATRTYINLV